jgi:polyribonucleotide nucleotidyltransferase
MGLVTDGERYTVLSDIQGIEDALGDMDFKVAGTRDGVTAIQMDIKVKGITTQIMRDALAQARGGRFYILDRMAEALPAPRDVRSEYAPSIVSVKIKPDQIGAVIGPGGKVIRAIQESTGTKIDIEDDGTVYISGVGQDATDAAVSQIRQLTYVPQVGDKITGVVKTIIPVGAFVEIAPGRDGFVHISQLSTNRVEQVEDAVSIGDVVDTVVTEIRNDGKINLSIRAALTGEMPAPSAPRDRRPGPPRDGGRERDFDRDRPRPQRREGADLADRSDHPRQQHGNRDGGRVERPAAGGVPGRPRDSVRRGFDRDDSQ